MPLSGRFDWLSARTPAMLGLDISSTAIKLLELEDAGRGQIRVARYAIESLPREAMSDGAITNTEQIAEVLRTAWSALGTRVRNVAIALPSAAVITKKILMPATLTGADLEAQIEAEANQAIPFALDEVNLDFQVLGPSAGSQADVEVLLAAARKDHVESRVAVVEAAGLKALVMDVDAYATVAAFQQVAPLLPANGAGQVIAIVDIGAVALHLTILHDGELVYQREHGFGAAQLNNEIARRYGMTPEEAELAKRRGSLPDSYEMEILQPFCETLALEIGRAIQVFTTSTHYSKVDHVLLAGGGAMLGDLDGIVSQRLGLPTLILNPFVNMAVSNHVKPQWLTRDAPALLVACGLALRRFDAQ